VTAAIEAIGAELASPLIGAFLVTGGRLARVPGLELDDVSFDRRTVIFARTTEAMRAWARRDSSHRRSEANARPLAPDASALSN
jgi:hypothetical protein